MLSLIQWCICPVILLSLWFTKLADKTVTTCWEANVKLGSTKTQAYYNYKSYACLTLKLTVYIKGLILFEEGAQFIERSLVDEAQWDGTGMPLQCLGENWAWAMWQMGAVCSCSLATCGIICGNPARPHSRRKCVGRWEGTNHMALAHQCTPTWVRDCLHK